MQVRELDERLEAVEARLTQRLAFSVESLGDLMKDQACKLRKLNEKVKAIEAMKNKSPKKMPASNVSSNPSIKASQVKKIKKNASKQRLSNVS